MGWNHLFRHHKEGKNLLKTKGGEIKANVNYNNQVDVKQYLNSHVYIVNSYLCNYVPNVISHLSLTCAPYKYKYFSKSRGTHKLLEYVFEKKETLSLYHIIFQ